MIERLEHRRRGLLSAGATGLAAGGTRATVVFGLGLEDQALELDDLVRLVGPRHLLVDDLQPGRDPVAAAEPVHHARGGRKRIEDGAVVRIGLADEFVVPELHVEFAVGGRDDRESAFADASGASGLDLDLLDGVSGRPVPFAGFDEAFEDERVGLREQGRQAVAVASNHAVEEAQHHDPIVVVVGGRVLGHRDARIDVELRHQIGDQRRSEVHRFLDHGLHDDRLRPRLLHQVRRRCHIRSRCPGGRASGGEREAGRLQKCRVRHGW